MPASLLSRGSLLSQRIDSPAAIAAGITPPFAGFPASQTVAQALRPFPQYLSVQSLFAGWGKSWYDALQAKVERRFGTFQLQANYTWSKSLGMGHYRQVFGQIGSPGATPQDYYNLDDSKSFTNFDIPHVFNILSTFDLPFGKGQKFLNSSNGVVSRLVGGWTIATAHSVSQGHADLVEHAGQSARQRRAVCAGDEGELVGSGPIRTGVDRTTLDPNDPNSRWFNPAAFTAAPAFTLGNAAFYYNDFRQPAVFTGEPVDREAHNCCSKLTTTRWCSPIRADAFNLFNRTNFGGIVGTVGNANFGRPTAPRTAPRIITMGLRLEF